MVNFIQKIIEIFFLPTIKCHYMSLNVGVELSIFEDIYFLTQS